MWQLRIQEKEIQQKKGAGLVWSLILPLALEWGITVLVKGAAQFLYIQKNSGRLAGMPQGSDEMAGTAALMSAELNQYATELTTIAAVIIIPVMLCLYYREKRWAGTDWWKQEGKICIQGYAALAVMGVAACIALNNLLQLAGVPAASESYQVTAEYMYESPRWIQFIGLGILIPIKEEMVYRLLLYRRMRRRISFALSLCMVSFLFGMNHGNLVQFLFAAVLGALMGYAYEVFRNAAVPILLHVIINLTSLTGTWTGFFEWMFTDILKVGTITLVTAVITVGIILKMGNIMRNKAKLTDK